MNAATAQPLFTAPSNPLTLIFTLTASHGSATSTDVVTVSVAPDVATSTVDETAVYLTPRGSVADSDYTYLQGANQVEVFVVGNKRYAVVASTDESIHLLDITDPANINELRHPNRQQQSGNNNFNNAIGGETAVHYIANDGNLYIVMSWSATDAIQTFHIHQNGRLDELAHVVDSSKMDLATDLFVYSVGDKHYAAVVATLSNSLRIVDVTDPRSLGTAALRGQITDSDDILLESPSGVAHYQKAHRHYAVVVTDSEDSVQIIDVTNPNSPFPAGKLRDNADLELNGAEDVAIYTVGGRTYAVVTGNTDDGIQIVDITNPHNISPAGQLEDDHSLLLDNPRGVAVHTIGDRHYAVVASSGDHGIQIVDITNPHNPVPKASVGDGQNGADELHTATGVDTFSVGNRHYAIVAANNDNGVQIVEMTTVTADARESQTVRAGQAVVLDGSASAVSSGATPTYQWSQTDGPPVPLQPNNTELLRFEAPSNPSTLIFQLAVTHGNATSTDVVTVSVAPDAARALGKTAVALTPRDSVEDSDFTYLQGARRGNQVEVFVVGNKRYAVVASTDESIHLLDITDPANINELRHPNRQQQSGNNNFNNAIGGETAVHYIANDGNLYIVMSWSATDAIQTFHIHQNGRLDELAHVIDKSKMDLATDLFVYAVQEGTCRVNTGCKVFPGDSGPVVNKGDPIYKQYAAVVATLSNSLRIVDVTDPRSLGTAALRGEITDNDDILLQGPSGVAHYQKGSRHYAVVVTDSEDSVQIIDVTNPNSPTAAGNLRDNADLELNGAEDVAIYEVEDRTYAVVTGNTDDGIQIVDITNPHNIFPAGQLEDDHSLLLDNPRGVAVHTIGDRHYAVVASSGDHGILVVDITDPHNPVPKASVGDGQNGADELHTATGVDTFSVGNRHYAIVAANNDNGVQMVEMEVLTADAGGDRAVPGSTGEVALDGSGSTVSSGVSPTYHWNQTAGPPITLSSATARQPSFVPPTAPQTLSFLLTVSHGDARAVDTVTITLEVAQSVDIESFGGQLVSDDIIVGTVNDPVGGTTSEYLAMYFSGEGESMTFTYRLLMATSTPITVEFLMTTLPEEFGKPGYEWDREAVSVSPRTLTFTNADWYTPQVVTVTSRTEGDDTPEQVIIVIQSSAPGSYSGIHVTVDGGPGPLGGVAGASGGPFLESPGTPVITLAGFNTMTVPLDSPWTDPGYTATDSNGNDITASVTVTGMVDTSQEGTYLLYYQVADSSGIPATPQIRTVNVVAPEPQIQGLQPEPEPQPQQGPEPEPKQEPPQEEPEPEPTQEPEQEPTQEPEQEPTQEPEQEPTQEPEQEQTQEPEQEPADNESDEQQTCDIPAIVRQYDTDGSCVIERGEWERAIDDYVAEKLNNPQIQTIAAHRG